MEIMVRGLGGGRGEYDGAFNDCMCGCTRHKNQTVHLSARRCVSQQC